MFEPESTPQRRRGGVQIHDVAGLEMLGKGIRKVAGCCFVFAAVAVAALLLLLRRFSFVVFPSSFSLLLRRLSSVVVTR